MSLSSEESFTKFDFTEEQLGELQSQIAFNYLKERGPVGDIIENYEHGMDRIVSNFKDKRILNESTGKYLGIIDAHWSSTTGSLSGDIDNVTRAMVTNSTFDTTLYAKFAIYDYYVHADKFVRDDNYNQSRDIALLRLPVMIGSRYDPTTKLTKEEKARIGIYESDPGGYFIIKGKEYNIWLREKLRRNVFISYYTIENKNRELHTRMISETSFLTQKTEIVGVEDSEGYRLSLLYYYKVHGNSQEIKTNVLTVMRAIHDSYIGVDEQSNNDVVSKYIVPFIPDKHYHSIITKLATVIANDNNDTDANLEAIASQLKNKIFAHIEGPDAYQHKLQLLGYMIVQSVMTTIGLREVNDRDDWSFKLLDTAANNLEFLADEIWSRTIKDKLSKYTNPTTIPSNLNIDNTVAQRAFTNANKWGVGKGKMYKDVAALLSTERINPIATLNKLLRITVPNTDASSNKSTKIRMIYPSQIGFVDPTETPTDVKCGIKKSKAMGSYITSYADPENIIENTRSMISDERDENHNDSLIINGIFEGFVDGNSYRDEVVRLRRYSRQTKLPIDDKTSAVYIPEDFTVYIYTMAQRITRPLLVLNYDQSLVDDLDSYLDKPFSDLVDNGVVEFIDTWEQSKHCVIAESYRKLEERKLIISNASIHGGDTTNLGRYTHLELDPSLIFGYAANTITYLEYNQAARNVIHCKMAGQGLGAQVLNPKDNIVKDLKGLCAPVRPTVYTKTHSLAGLDDHPSGITVKMAIMPYFGWNQEDSIVFKKSAVERGLGMYYTQKIYSSTDKANDRIVGIADGKEKLAKYRHIDPETGLPFMGSYLRHGDIVMAMYKIEGDQEIEANYKLGRYEDGIVDYVYSMRSSGQYSVRVTKVHQLQVGDKTATVSAQKATISAIVDESDMPFNEQGVTPDILFNPQAIPSRMTVGQLMQVFAGKAAQLEGSTVDASFGKKFDLVNFTKTLVDHGYSYDGTETYTDSVTGQQIEAPIYSGPLYLHVVKHQIDDKVKVRSKGLYEALSGQPVGGRDRDGGQRIGQMEVDVMVSHGVPNIIQERLNISSDGNMRVICLQCDQPANLVGSKYVCNNDSCTARDRFGVCNIPQSVNTLQKWFSGMGLGLDFQYEGVE